MHIMSEAINLTEPTTEAAAKTATESASQASGSIARTCQFSFRL